MLKTSSSWRKALLWLMLTLAVQMHGLILLESDGNQADLPSSALAGKSIGKRSYIMDSDMNDVECRDERPDCASFVQLDFCNTHRRDMLRWCRKSCLYCCPDNDPLGDKRCRVAVRTRECRRNQKMMKLLCPNACEFCNLRPPSPPACSTLPFGCCWDMITPANGPNGDGCPVCKDSRSPLFCRRFRTNCFSQIKTTSIQMQAFCPDTCGLCKETCRDDNTHSDFCPNYKEQGLCPDENVMLACPKTCNKCQAMDCSSSPFHCCQDNVTLASGPNRQGCPECIDRSKNCADVSKLNLCSDPKHGPKARSYCPVSCRVCGF